MGMFYLISRIKLKRGSVKKAKKWPIKFMYDLPIVIVGGGVAGLATAIALAVHGIKSIVIERAKKVGEVDRGDVLHKSTIDIFNGWNVPQLTQYYNAIEITKFCILNMVGQKIFQFDLTGEMGLEYAFTVLRHPDIERALEETALKTSLVSVMRGVSCSDLITNGHRITGVVTSSGVMHSALTVIANGAQSKLRNNYFQGGSYHQYPVSFYNARFKLIPEFSDTGYYVLGKGGVMIMVPLPNNEMRIGIQTFNRSDKQDLPSPNNIKSIIQERLRTFPVDELNFIDAHTYKVSKSLSKTFYIPGAVLVGDAAHTVHPAGGQGMNLAIQDAQLLGELLSSGNLSDDLVSKACLKYSQQRRKELKAILRRTHFMGQMSLTSSDSVIKSRELLLRSTNKMPKLKKMVFRRIVMVN